MFFYCAAEAIGAAIRLGIAAL